MTNLETREEWRIAARSLIQNIQEDCAYWVSRLQPRRRGLTPGECFALFSKLGRLNFHQWSRTLPPEEVRGATMAANKLQQQLSDAVAKWTVPSANSSMVQGRFEKGMEEQTRNIESGIAQAKPLIEAKELAGNWDSTEFDYFILHYRDEIGYATKLLAEIRLSCSPEITGKLDTVDQALKRMLPEAIRQYKDFGDPIDGGRPVYPENFWWRKNTEYNKKNGGVPRIAEESTELWIEQPGSDLCAVDTTTGAISVYDPVRKVLRTFMAHPQGYEWIKQQIESRGWVPAPR